MLISILKRKNNLLEEKLNNWKYLIIPFGTLMMIASLLINHYMQGNNFVDFASGFLLGLSLVANLVGIIIVSSKFK